MKARISIKSEKKAWRMTLFVLIIGIFAAANSQFGMHSPGQPAPSLKKSRDGEVMFKTPGSQCIIYYITSGDNAVADDDVFGYGANEAWREKNGQPNNVPDYIDELGWTVDSAWSMFVDRFGFLPPVGILESSDMSNTFKLATVSFNGARLGRTEFSTRVSPDKPGYRSITYIRNSYDGTALSDTKIAFRVICPHEIFHAVQYSYTRFAQDVKFDDFPLSWIEGTATMMALVAFPYPRYYSLAKSHFNTWFDNPDKAIFRHVNDGKSEYAGMLAATYLYYHADNEPSIGFIKDVFESNYNDSASFVECAGRSAQKRGTTWRRMLCDFYAESFFTGNRADERYFFPEADRLGKWDYSSQTLDRKVSYEVAAAPWAMARQGLTVDGGEAPLKIGVLDEETGGLATDIWAASVIVRSTEENRTDTLYQLPASGGLTIDIPSGGAELIVIATNGSNAQRKALVAFDDMVPAVSVSRPVARSFSILPGGKPQQAYSILGRRMPLSHEAVNAIIVREKKMLTIK